MKNYFYYFYYYYFFIIVIIIFNCMLLMMMMRSSHHHIGSNSKLAVTANRNSWYIESKRTEPDTLLFRTHKN